MAKGMSIEDLRAMYGIDIKVEETKPRSQDKKPTPKTSNNQSPNKPNPNHSNRSYNGGGGNFNTGTPTAPYNFIRLNNTIVSPPLAKAIGSAQEQSDIAKNYKQFINSGTKHSGYFDVTVKNLTPLFIGGGNKGDFFNNGQDICIPGSSMRGCLKNTFKIITNSAFRSNKENPDIGERYLYFRSFASGLDEFRKLYTDRMTPIIDGRAQNIASAGILVCKDKKYYICPAQFTIEKWQSKLLKEQNGQKTKLFVGLNPNFQGVPCVKWHNDHIDIFSGKIDHKKSFYRITSVDWKTQLEIPANIIDDYLKDKGRKGLAVIPETDKQKRNLFDKCHAINPQQLQKQKLKQNDMSCYSESNIVAHVYTGRKQNKDYTIPAQLRAEYKRIVKEKYQKDTLDTELSRLAILQGAEQYNYAIPCFYIEANGTVQHFGFNRYYRIPYNKSIAAHIPADIDNAHIDFADALFGRKTDWSSRVSFEDMYLTQDSPAKCENQAYRKILAAPNPTSFQFYLEKNKNKAAFWEGTTNIRGYKMYWHTDTDWRETNPKNQKDNMTCRITPLSRGCQFTGRIHFENLDTVELGALCALFSLSKENGICHKLGMGKSIGMGTVKITAELHLQDNKYYTQLFDNNGFAQCHQHTDLQEYTDHFNNYIQQQLNNAEWLGYQERMEELRLIMSTNHKQKPTWNNQTRYMDINNKGDKDIMNKRVPLPTISEIVSKKK